MISSLYRLAMQLPRSIMAANADAARCKLKDGASLRMAGSKEKRLKQSIQGEPVE